MANDRWYNPGDHYILDDLSGFKVRYTSSRKIPAGQTGNLLVDWRRWEDQQPQDLVRGVVDDQSVAEARSRQVNRFVVTGTWVTAPAPRLSNVIQVNSAIGFAAGSLVQVMLDSGENFNVYLGAVTSTSMTLGAPLPWSVGGNLGDPIENTVLLLTNGPAQNLYNDNGVLAISPGVVWPGPALSGGTLYSNGGVASVSPGAAFVSSAPPLFLGSVTAATLLAAGSAGLPWSAPAAGSYRLWNPGGSAGGDIWVA